MPMSSEKDIADIWASSTDCGCLCGSAVGGLMVGLELLLTDGDGQSSAGSDALFVL